ncbi:MAG TPA: ethanolamine ammonia-lyase subunit EutC [Acetobacteraceae bacterium]|nr:ethanolamine ammonia-lyase subunit EutC [Acetobacteraceae bacterium]
MTSRSDVWASLRSATPARIGLGRRGDAPPLEAMLAFQLAHARARDAVHTALDVPALGAALGGAVVVRSAAPDRDVYLRRPDLGRRLHPSSRAVLTGVARPEDGWDAVFVLADGLSAAGVQRSAVPLLEACRTRLPGWSLAPVVIATQARVALGDAIGEVLGARLCVMLIGERPGLSVANSLGVYLTWQPCIGRRDAERNCVSNIHPDGLSCDAAAEQVTWLMTEARRRGLTGVALKRDGVAAALPG